MSRYNEDDWENDEEYGEDFTRGDFERRREEILEEEMETPDVPYAKSIEMIMDSEKRINEKRIGESLLDRVDKMHSEAEDHQTNRQEHRSEFKDIHLKMNDAAVRCAILARESEEEKLDEERENYMEEEREDDHEEGRQKEEER
jgi:hypothetical protein